MVGINGVCDFTDYKRLEGIISAVEWFHLTRTVSSELVLIIKHSRHSGKLFAKNLSTGTTKRSCCDSYGTNGSMKL